MFLQRGKQKLIYILKRSVCEEAHIYTERQED